MDRLEAADIERADAALALDREHKNDEQVDRMRANHDGRTADSDGPSVDPSRRPVHDDYRDDNNQVDWARFRAAMTAWEQVSLTVPEAPAKPTTA